MSIGLVILAAGASKRMGTPKQLLPYRGTSLLHHTINVALESACRPIIVVLGAYCDRIEPTVKQLPIHIIENTDWEKGMGTSIRAGVKALEQIDPYAEGVVITVCDQPFLSVDTIARLVDTYTLTNGSIVASEYTNTLGVPALFDRTLFAELTALDASVGAKQVMRKYDRVVRVSFPEGALDLDTPQDYDRALLDRTMEVN